MTTATWPSTTAQAPIFGMREQRQRNVVAFKPDSGNPKIRRRSTAVCVDTLATFRMDDTELAAFKTFYETTLFDGTLPFDWAHPVTGVTYTWMFSPDDAPEIEATEYGLHTVTCRLLRLPS